MITEHQANSTERQSLWRIPAIDGLRGIAALMVYFFHVWEFAGKPSLQLSLGNTTVNIFAPLSNLPSFVDLFMVLSGFCLFLPLCKTQGLQKWGLKEYFKRRFRRIIPPYYFSLLYVTILPILLVMLMRVLGKEADWQPLPTAWDAITHLLFIHTFFNNTWSSMNGSLWTIGLEMHFYLVFPIAIWGYRRWGIKVAGGMIAASLLYRLLVVPALVHAEYTTEFLPSIFFLGRWMQFATGMLAAWLVAQFWQRHQHRNAGWGIPVLILSLFIYQTAHSPLAKDFNIYPVRDTLLSVAFGLVIVAFCICAMRLRFLVENKIIVWFGFISYSFYLIHQPTAWYLSELCRKHGGLTGNTLFFILSTFGLLVVTCVAYLFFLFCERPYLNKVKKENVLQTDNAHSDSIQPMNVAIPPTPTALTSFSQNEIPR